MSIIFENEKQLLEFTQGIIGKSFKEIDVKKILLGNNNDKGRLGKVVETGFYGYDINSSPEADFDKLGIELKVSGFRKLKDGSWSAKERISLSMINYKNIIHEEYEFSKLISKNRKLLIIWYEYMDDVPYSDFVIYAYQLYDMTADEAIIRNDFYTIRQKVLNGLAHRLSEGDTVILGAATKGKKGQKAEQPNCKILAPTRAYSLKNSFFRGVLKNYIEGRPREDILRNPLTPEEFVWNQLKQYQGLTQLEILSYLEKQNPTKKVPYSISKMISNRVLGSDNELAKKHEIFNKSTTLIKNIPILADNRPIEKATFSTLQHSDFNTSWDDSEWKTFFQEVTFIYIGYLGEVNGNKLENGYRLLDRIYKVTFTPAEVEAFGETYNMIKEVIETKDIKTLPTATLNNKNNLGLNLVISTKGNGTGGYKRFLQDTRETCFMLNKDFIHKKLNKALTLR